MSVLLPCRVARRTRVEDARPDRKGFERLAERIAGDLAPEAAVTWGDHLPGLT
jgi:hypothetical protein